MGADRGRTQEEIDARGGWPQIWGGGCGQRSGGAKGVARGGEGGEEGGGSRGAEGKEVGGGEGGGDVERGCETGRGTPCNFPVR